MRNLQRFAGILFIDVDGEVKWSFIQQGTLFSPVVEFQHHTGVVFLDTDRISQPFVTQTDDLRVEHLQLQAQTEEMQALINLVKGLRVFAETGLYELMDVIHLQGMNLRTERERGKSVGVPHKIRSVSHGIIDCKVVREPTMQVELTSALQSPVSLSSTRMSMLSNRQRT